MLFTLPSLPPLHELYDAIIEESLARCGGNRTQAARLLEISVRTLQRRLKTSGAGAHR
jgi:DNA-binding NtrC family response regulator